MSDPIREVSRWPDISGSLSKDNPIFIFMKIWTAVAVDIAVFFVSAANFNRVI
jgi:hypothetical protein